MILPGFTGSSPVSISIEPTASQSTIAPTQLVLPTLTCLLVRSFRFYICENTLSIPTCKVTLCTVSQCEMKSCTIIVFLCPGFCRSSALSTCRKTAKNQPRQLIGERKSIVRLTLFQWNSDLWCQAPIRSHFPWQIWFRGVRSDGGNNRDRGKQPISIAVVTTDFTFNLA
jgi:hypothetical protein